MEKIIVDNLSFRYPLSEKPALTGVSLSVHPSEFIVLCGRSGCGKSTLLRHMKKSLIPYGEQQGQVLIDGEPVEEMDDRTAASKVGFVLQNPDSQLVTDKVWHELAFGLENLGLPNQVIKRRVAEMASYFGIHTWFRKDVAALSGGQKQLLNLASVMAMQPEILILDEPTSQLDPISAGEFLKTLQQINRDMGTTILISEHRLEDVFPMADRVIVLDQGALLTMDEPGKVGKRLAGSGDEGHHPMYEGLPAVMRAFPEDEEDAPLTIREGRLKLAELMDNIPPERAAQALSAPVSRLTSPGSSLREADPAIRLKNVFFRYARNTDDVLRGLDLSVPKGALTCLLGGNGSGKSTSLKVICGVLKPQRGKVTVAEGLSLSMVPQNPQAIFTEITAEEEVFEGMAGLSLSDEEKLSRTEEMLSMMEIAHLRKANPSDLSGGEQQRLAMGKVMSRRPDILLLDEPTKGLDPFFKQTLGRILKRMTASGVTIFMVSHDIDFCANFGDLCAMFFDGEITLCDEVRPFFAGNSFYTTTSNKLVRRWREDILLCEEVRAWITQLS